jgi:hypothetical protein
MTNGDGEIPANIYGEITANNRYGVIDLFRGNPRGRYVDIYPGTVVPLLRTIMAVPMTGALRIDAHLTAYDTVSQDDEIANGTAVFTRQFKKSATNQFRAAMGRSR